MLHYEIPRVRHVEDRRRFRNCTHNVILGAAAIDLFAPNKRDLVLESELHQRNEYALVLKLKARNPRPVKEVAQNDTSWVTPFGVH